MRFVYEGLLVIQFALSYGWCWIELEMPFIIFFFLSFYCASCILYLTWLLMNYLSSGDTDAVVPVTATRYSIDALKLPTITNWSPWYDNGKVSDIYMSMLFTTRNLNCNCMFLIETSVIDIVTKFVYKGLQWSFISQMLPLCCDMQVGGWSQIYKGLTLVTITGAGHEVPLHRPREAFILFRSFLENKPMPR